MATCCRSTGCGRRPRFRLVTLAAVLMVVLAGCGSSLFDPPVTIAVGTDNPGMHFQGVANQRSGFDVDFYRWLAASSDPKFVPAETDVNVKDRVNVLRTGAARMVVSSFSITDERKDEIDFSAPYVQTYQGVMLRAGDARVRTLADLEGKSFCAQTESTSIAELRQLTRVTVVERVGLDECVGLLDQGLIDGVSTDQILLYGYTSHRPGLAVVPGLTFGALGLYGVGLPPGPGTSSCEEMNGWVGRFIDQGQWDIAFRANFPGVDPTGFKPETKDQQPCDDDDDGVS